jgi:sugar O-acyltransferase (sialic acid O-acetyltransferase NeuD family)
MKDLIILGTGGSSIDILDSINDINTGRKQTAYRCLGFLDDDRTTWNRVIHGVRVLGSLSTAAHYPDCCFVNGIGNPLNFHRKSGIISQIGIPETRFETIVHPSASVSRMSHLGPGTVVFQNVVITSNVTVGKHVIILPNTVVSHDDTIGDYTCIAGGACISGGVRIGHSCYLGTNCSINGNISIGNTCVIGMGSVVLKDVLDNTVVAGNPARFLRKTIE